MVIYAKPKKSKLFVCASCEWIFKNNSEGCPMCGFGYYSAHFVYGKKAYQYFKTQHQWKERKLFNETVRLEKIISDNTEYKKTTAINYLQL